MPCDKQETREEKLKVVADQLRELAKQKQWPTVTCFCGRVRTLLYAWRCLYCGEWYCQTCAEQHFGMTRAEWNKKATEEVTREST